MKPVDENGYPGTISTDGKYDGGDTAAILGTLWFFGQMRDKSLPLHDASIPIRHPDQTRWYGQPDRFSRDQLIAVLCGISTVPVTGFFPLFRAHRRKLFLKAWNTRGNGAMDLPEKSADFTGPDVWALWLRIFKPFWARLFLGLFDLDLLLAAIHWRFFRKDRVCRNFMLELLVAKKHLPTLVSRLAFRITNWEDLIGRWRGHCDDVQEYQTADLFESRIKEIRNG